MQNQFSVLIHASGGHSRGGGGGGGEGGLIIGLIQALFLLFSLV